jgi:mannose-6-phosphate isomerase-like protein (cupin superfamily)
VIDKNSAERYTWGENCLGWHLVKSDSFSVIQESMPPHTSETRHRHSTARQFFFVLSGQGSIESDGTTHILGIHQGLEVPPRIPHQVFNHSEADLEFLVISVPPSHGDRTPA